MDISNDVSVQSDDGLVLVELEWLGEGLSGDYSEDDPSDVPLMRFSVCRRYYGEDGFENCCEPNSYEHGDFAAVRDASYCTLVDARLPKEQLEKVARFILSHVYDSVKSLCRERRLYESLSWVEIVNGELFCKGGGALGLRGIVKP